MTPPSRLSATLNCSPRVPCAGHVSVVAEHGHSPGSSATTAHPVRTSDPLFVAEQESVEDDVPTQRQPPRCVEEPDVEKRGGIVHDRDLDRFFAFAPGAVCLGAYATEAHAQNRLDLYFGRTIRLAKCDLYRSARKESA